MATPGYNRARDFGLLLKNLSSFSDNQARVVTYDEDQLRWLDIEIRPNDGRYKGGAFFFQLYMGTNFPRKPPIVHSLSPIYHPNIDVRSKEVCLNLFSSAAWLPSFGLQDAIQGLLFLMYQPNLESALADYVTCETFESDVTLALDGKLEIEEKDFGKRNTEHVERYYEQLAAKKKIEGGAAAAEAAVPLADVVNNHVTTLLDKERMKIKLKPVVIPHGSMIPSHFHSRQVHKLIKSSSIHGLLHHPDLQVPTTYQPTHNDANPRHMLQRSLTICTGSHEHFRHSKCKKSDVSRHMEITEPLYISGRSYEPDTAKSLYDSMLAPFYIFQQ